MVIEIIVPAAGESVKEADVVNWLKQSGEFVNQNDPLVELETEKATLELVAEQSGTLEIMVPSGVVNVGDVIAKIHQGAQTGPVTTNTQSTSFATPAPSVASETIASPAAQRLMSEANVAISEGTGKAGRVTKQDVLAHMADVPVVPPVEVPPLIKDAQATTSLLDHPSVVSPASRATRLEPMTRLRKTIMSRLLESQQSTASLTTFNEIDMSHIMEIRKKYKDGFKDKYNVGLGFMSFFTKAACQALLEFPVINSYVSGDDILFHDYCDIGIAVAAPKGLMVPVIRDAQALSFDQIESSISDYAQKARQNKLTLQEMEGGTFTITNGGVFGSMMSMPIINRPQSAIMGMHNIVNRPVAIGDQVVVRPIMYVALTYDHRIIDGSDAVRFLVRIKEQIEDPIRLLVKV